MSGSQGQPWVQCATNNTSSIIVCSTPASRPGSIGPVGSIVFLHGSSPDAALPTPFLKDTPYFIATVNSTNNQIIVSLTKGGSPVTATQTGTMGVELVLPGLFSGGDYISDDNHRTPQNVPKPFQSLDAGWQSQKVSDGTTGPSQPQQAGVGQVPPAPYFPGQAPQYRSVLLKTFTLGTGADFAPADGQTLPNTATNLTLSAPPAGYGFAGGFTPGNGFSFNSVSPSPQVRISLAGSVLSYTSPGFVVLSGLW